MSEGITQIVSALFKGITTGTAVFTAQAYGARDYKKMKKVIRLVTDGE